MKFKNYILNLLIRRLQTCVIFNFHDIVSDARANGIDQVSEATFRQQLNWINEHFLITRIDGLLDTYKSRNHSKPMAAITFDDGYRSHFTIVKPILDELGIKATFYVSSNHLTKDFYWHDLIATFCNHAPEQKKKELNDLICSISKNSCESIIEKVKYLKLTERAYVLSSIERFTKPLIAKRLLMNVDEIRILSEEGHLIGGHTLNHPILSLETDETCEKEIRDDLNNLEVILSKKIETFAYPNGIPGQDYNKNHEIILSKSGIRFAVNTNKSILTNSLDNYSVPRISLFGSNDRLHCNYMLRMIVKSLFLSGK